MKKISVIVPCYNEEESLGLFYQEITKVTKEIDAEFEFVFVDDGSKDGTLSIIKSFRKKDKRVRFISFARNFGKEAGNYAGIKAATGDYVVLIDADLQHDPKLIKTMYEIISEGSYETVAVKRFNRTGEGARSFLSKMFFKFLGKISEIETVEGEMDFRMMSRKMVDAVLQLSENNRYTKGIFSWVGFETKWIEQPNIERKQGTTKWSFKSLFKYALEGIFAFSTKPLFLSTLIGIIFCLIAFIIIVVVVIKTLIFGEVVQGFPTLICVILLASGTQLFCLGIMSEYLSKMYLEIKNRPIYIAKETSEDEK